MSDGKSSDEHPHRPPNAMYAVALQQARASGDLQKMRELSTRAHEEASSDPEIQSALLELDAEIARRSSAG